MFPNLIKELEEGDSKVKIDSVRANTAQGEEGINEADDALTEEAEAALPDKFRHYNPTAVDFIRRCDSAAQVEEIVIYLLKRGEITKEYAAEIRRQIKKDGLRSFGPKKEEGDYFKQGGIC